MDELIFGGIAGALLRCQSGLQQMARGAVACIGYKCLIILVVNFFDFLLEAIEVWEALREESDVELNAASNNSELTIPAYRDLIEL